MLGSKLNHLPESESEQVRYRAEKCKNGGRFPDLIDAESLDKYKKEHNVNFK